MNPTVFRALRDLAYEQAGISLSDEKVPLVAARVGKRLNALGLKDERAYLEFLRADRSGQELVQFLDVISTNFTSFFREPGHFERLARDAAGWLEDGRSSVRVWCAASSSGEEPYTLAMVLDEAFKGRMVDWKILATDISTKVLAQAQAGRYVEKQLGTVNRELKARYFTRTAETDRGGEAIYQVSPQLRQRITFARLNLAQPPYPMKGPFDAIFCRNVMIYFDARVRQGIVHEMERLSRPGTGVMVGHAETLSGLSTRLEVVVPSVYRMPGGAR